MTRSLGIVAALGFVFAISVHAADEKPKAMVFVSKVKAVELFDLLSYPARVVPKINTTLLAETDGVVSSIEMGLGKRVSKGQKILTITHTDPVYQYAPAQILSPVSGVVSSLEVTEGTQVSRGQKIGAVTDPSKVRVTVEIPGQDLLDVKTGMPGELKISGSEKPLAVKIRGVSPFVDPASGTAVCEMDLVSGKEALAPGTVGQVSFKTKVRKGFNVPDHALTYKGNDPFIRIVDAQKAKRVAVKLGARQRGYVEILDGLPEDSVMVERSSRFVADGEEVTVQNPEALK